VRPSDFQRQFSAEPTALVPGTLRGYRTWQVTLEMGLKSVSHDYVWPHTLDATCLATGGAHDAPGPNCTCGIYACHRPDDEQVAAKSVLHPGHTVTGVVEAWGRVQLGARGFRAQHAKIVALEFALPRSVNLNSHIPGKFLGRTLHYELPDGRTVKASDLPKYWSDPRDWQMQLRRNYPHVTMFRDRNAMLAVYPPVDVSTLAPSRT
jgi:hypothetical protein